MNTSTMITVAIIIAIVLVLYLVLSMNKKNKEKKRLQALSDLASKQNCSITKYEFDSKISLGLDEKNNFLFYVKTIGENAVTRYINLSEVKKCKVVNTNRTVRFNNSNSVVVERLEISFEPNGKTVEPALLEFYNVNTDGSILNGELQLAEKWSAIVTERLNAKKVNH
ncbi:MAG TPA: hypothetical protein VK872_15980 [Draconibacterium sp.]|jgi:hypothetical protein|nr:hypothetical protein [Draconibacterium sp.]